MMKNHALGLKIGNALMFQLGWFICVLMGNFAGVLFTLAAVTIHFFLSRERVKDLAAIALAGVMGFAHDFLLMTLGLVRFSEPGLLPPPWLTCLWVLFALTLNHSLQWIYLRPLWSSVLGCLFAPLSYMAGVHLSSAEWSGSLWAVIPIIAALWLFILPVHYLFCRRIEKYVEHRFQIH
jgi:hypothetical protein